MIHETAVMGQGARIGKGSKVRHFCNIGDDVSIGENCVIGQGVFIAPNVCIPDGVKIQNNVSIYSGVILAEHVFVGPSVVFTNVVNPRSFIERKTEFRNTFVDKGASIGANSTILCGVKIGQYALVGAGSVVTKDVPDFGVVVGNHCSRIGWVDKSGDPLDFTNLVNDESLIIRDKGVYKLTRSGVIYEANGF